VSGVAVGGDAPSFAMLTDTVLEQFSRRGYERHGHRSVQADRTDTSLFVSGGIQNWRSWFLDPAEATGARVGAQWCVRMNRLADLDHKSGTSFCMVSAVRRGMRDRRPLISDTVEILADCGVDPGALAFVVSGADADRPADDHTYAALRQLGVPPERIAVKAQRWSRPFRPLGPTGPNLFVLMDTDAECSPSCSPLCGCGRYLHFWNCEFLDHTVNPQGMLVAAAMPGSDIAGSTDRLTLARRKSTGSFWDSPELAGSVAAARKALIDGAYPGLAQGRHFPLFLDHGRTVALLLGSGVTMSARAHGHVLRRLIRRMATALIVESSSPELTAPLVAAASASVTGAHGFPAAESVRSRLSEIDAEVAGFVAHVDRGRRRFETELAHRSSDQDLAEAMFRIKSSLGVPMDILLAWLNEEGADVGAKHLHDLLSHERIRSRSGQEDAGHA